MADIVIPLIRSTVDNHLELKYVLRSMQANLIGVGKLILVGYRPKWCKPDIFIPHDDATDKSDKEYNIFCKLVTGHAATSETFLYANDDHFLLRRRRIDKFPNYYQKQFGGSGNYTKTVENTRNLIGQSYNFDVHCPILIDWGKFSINVPVEWPAYGYCLKTVYYNHPSGVEYQDMKIRNPEKYNLAGRDWFSTDNGALRGKLLREVQKLWPTKSKWEI